MTDHGTLAEQLYTAYGESSDWLNFQETRMPPWDELPEKIQDHWCAAARKAVELLILPM